MSGREGVERVARRVCRARRASAWPGSCVFPTSAGTPTRRDATVPLVCLRSPQRSSTRQRVRRRAWHTLPSCSPDRVNRRLTAKGRKGARSLKAAGTRGAGPVESAVTQTWVTLTCHEAYHRLAAVGQKPPRPRSSALRPSAVGGRSLRPRRSTDALEACWLGRRTESRQRARSPSSPHEQARGDSDTLVVCPMA